MLPELTRTYAVMGSLVNLVISAGPSVAKDTWKIILQARSLENLFPSVYCNVVGTQKDFSFFGGSKIVNASGMVTDEAKFDEEDFIVGTVDIAEALLLRRQWLMFRERAPRSVRPADGRAARSAAGCKARVAGRSRDRSPHGFGRRVAA